MSRSPKAKATMTQVLSEGWLEANRILVGVALVAVAVATALYLWRRFRRK